MDFAIEALPPPKRPYQGDDPDYHERATHMLPAGAAYENGSHESGSEWST
jgi:hypothetical protein